MHTRKPALPHRLRALIQSMQPEKESPGGRDISTNGYLSFSYTYNVNTPSPRINQFRVFDFNDDDPQLDVAQLVIQRAISEPKQFGFRFDLMTGSGVPEVTAAYGLFRNTHTGVAHHFDIPQSFISYIVPVAKGLRFDLGKFRHPHGIRGDWRLRWLQR